MRDNRESSMWRLGMRRAAFAVLLTAVSWTVCPATAAARQLAPTPPPTFNHGHQPGMDTEQPEPLSGSNAQKLEHMRQEDRRKHLLSDTEKLLQLSTELKSEVDKSSKDELSLDVVRKAAEIEKLAHDVKERMKG